MPFPPGPLACLEQLAVLLVQSVRWIGPSAAAGGEDTFIFQGDFVGTQNYIYDFNQSQLDKMEFSGVTGIDSFSDLTIAQSGLDTLITAGADQLTLVNYDDTEHPLIASDFLFA